MLSVNEHCGLEDEDISQPANCKTIMQKLTERSRVSRKCTD